MDEQPYRVVIADDNADVRVLARRALERSGRFHVVGIARDGREAVTVTARQRPDVTLLDLVMPDTDGLTVLPAIRDAHPGVTVVVLTGLQQPSVADDALAAGATGLLTKRASWDELPSDLLRLLDREPPDAAATDHQELLALPADLTSGRAARRLVRRALHDWQLPELVGDAELLTSELVNNAVLHASSDVQLRLFHEPERLRVEVTDRGGGALQRRFPALTDDNGRGLLLVAALASTWGTAASAQGKTVWFELETGRPHGDGSG